MWQVQALLHAWQAVVQLHSPPSLTSLPPPTCSAYDGVSTMRAYDSGMGVDLEATSTAIQLFAIDASTGLRSSLSCSTGLTLATASTCPPSTYVDTNLQVREQGGGVWDGW